MPYDQKRNRVLVVGGSGGIGSQIAIAYAKLGYDIDITFHENEDKAIGYKKAIEQNAVGEIAVNLHCLDLRDSNSVEKLFSQLSNLDILVFSAATDIPKGVDEATYTEWREVTSVMLDGAFLCTRFATALIAKSDNPNIVYISSMDGIRPDGEYIAYQVGEAGLIALTKANAKYLGNKYGIRVNALCPGPIRTGLWDKVGESTDSMWEELDNKSPMKRVGTPQDVANACISLTEDPGRFLNGNLIFIDGGSGL